MNTFTPNTYTRELQLLRPHDEIQHSRPGPIEGTIFIATAGHGYLAVPMRHEYNREARALCAYGYQGRHATYLEEDSEAPAFIQRVTDIRERTGYRKLPVEHHINNDDREALARSAASCRMCGQTVDTRDMRGNICKYCAEDIPS